MASILILACFFLPHHVNLLSAQNRFSCDLLCEKSGRIAVALRFFALCEQHARKPELSENNCELVGSKPIGISRFQELAHKKRQWWQWHSLTRCIQPFYVRKNARWYNHSGATFCVEVLLYRFLHVRVPLAYAMGRGLGFGLSFRSQRRVRSRSVNEKCPAVNVVKPIVLY